MLRVRVTDNESATVFAISLDGAPLAESQRILVTHLTDCRASGFATIDPLGSIILRWNGSGNPDGTVPLFLKDGTAEISLDVSAGSAGWKVWALAADGSRKCEVPSSSTTSSPSSLSFKACVRQPFGGCMCYEVSAPSVRF